MCKVKKTDDPGSGQLSLLKIPILVDKEAVLNEIPVREAMDFYTMDEICENINDEEYLERCDIDLLLQEIDGIYQKKIIEFLKEKDVDDLLNDVPKDIIMKHARQIAEAGE